MTWQGDRLARRLFVVALDQRGVLRSDPLAAGEVLTEQVLVDDCEAVRPPPRSSTSWATRRAPAVVVSSRSGPDA
jgi:hypothetical protein